MMIKRILTYTSIFVLILLMLFLFPFIDNFLSLQATYLHNSFSDPIMLWISIIGSGIVLFIIASLLFLFSRKRKLVIPLWLGFALSSVIVFSLKLILMWERPFELLDLQAFKEFAFWNSSFPSWHAAMAFAALPFISKGFPRISVLWIILALVMIFSRIYLGYHFVSDIIAGALIGYFSGFIFLKVWKRRRKSKSG